MRCNERKAHFEGEGESCGGDSRMRSIGNDEAVGRMHGKHILHNQLPTRPRKSLMSLNYSSGDLEDGSKAVRDQMQIRFISVKPDGERKVESSVRPFGVNTASTSAPAFGGLLLRGYANPYCHSSLSRVHLHFVLVLPHILGIFAVVSLCPQTRKCSRTFAHLVFPKFIR